MYVFGFGDVNVEQRKQNVKHNIIEPLLYMFHLHSLFDKS